MNLRYIRDMYELSQKDVAKILGVSVASYSLWETEKYIIPLNRLITFCNHFHVSLDYTLGLTRTIRYKNMKTEIDYNLHRKRLRFMRKEKRYTQEYIAKLLNTDSSVISRYESGKTLILTSFLIEYSKIFNVSCDYIMARIDVKIPIKKKKAIIYNS